MSAMGTALVTTLRATAAVTAAAPGGVWRDVAPASQTPPFIIVSLQGAETDDEFAHHQVETEYWTVRAVTKGPSGAGAATAAAAVYTALHGAALTVTGYTAMDCSYDQAVDYLETDGETRWYHRGGIYRVTGHR